MRAGHEGLAARRNIRMHTIDTDDTKHLVNDKKHLLDGLHGTLRKKAIGWLKKNG
jgi:hypothetical protein